MHVVGLSALQPASSSVSPSSTSCTPSFSLFSPSLLSLSSCRSSWCSPSASVSPFLASPIRSPRLRTRSRRLLPAIILCITKVTSSMPPFRAAARPLRPYCPLSPGKGDGYPLLLNLVVLPPCIHPPVAISTHQQSTETWHISSQPSRTRSRRWLPVSSLLQSTVPSVLHNCGISPRMLKSIRPAEDAARDGLIPRNLFAVRSATFACIFIAQFANV
ncbi:hypothetical protein PYCCODRAFT_1226524 [Trametes coccinea BRFM310]|uniref:Uncharacterized protein n=1 Tax=Trametes coccinea (strain BRFM310) TaxID=1353009 RepID=A0A1Y2IW20_TRAC3|nr:hypothetical protein PYCCODRAFT_1226524 [Trametes coccinea BRFM310]